MSLIIKNIAVTALEIDDLGISLEIAETYDVGQDNAVDVAGSTDIIDAINADDIIVLDPLDNVTDLSKVQSIECILAHNDSHFRIRGGELNQLDDVSAPTPLDAYVLTYVGSNQRWEPKPPSGGGSSNSCFPFFRANGSQDNIVVTAGLFPFFRANGTQDNITISIC